MWRSKFRRAKRQERDAATGRGRRTGAGASGARDTGRAMKRYLTGRVTVLSWVGGCIVIYGPSCCLGSEYSLNSRCARRHADRALNPVRQTRVPGIAGKCSCRGLSCLVFALQSCVIRVHAGSGRWGRARQPVASSSGTFFRLLTASLLPSRNSPPRWVPGS